MSTPPEPFCTAIGRIAVLSASIDFNLSRILVALNGGQGTAAMVAGQGYGFLDKALRALAREMEDSSAKTLTDLLDRIAGPHKRRDTAVHGIWIPADVQAYARGADSAEHYAWRPRWWKDTLSGEKFSLEQLNELADQLNSLDGSTGKYRIDYVDGVRWRKRDPG